MNNFKFKKNLMDNIEDVESIPLLLKPGAEEIQHLMDIINQRQFEQAVTLAQSMAMRFPLQVLGWKVLGNVLNDMGKYEDALLPIKMVVILAPYDAEANSNYGLQLKLLGQFEEAEARCRLAVQYDPKLTEAHNNLGITLLEMERLEEAEACFLKVIENEPDHPFAYNSLGVTSANLGRPNFDYFEKALTLNPDLGDVHSNYLFISTMSASASIDATNLYNKHLRYAELFETPFISQWQPHENVKDSQRCLKIGFVSGDLCGHALSSFLEPLLIHLSKISTLSLHAYYNNSIEDAISLRLKDYFKSWTTVLRLNIVELANKIRDDGIDILFDLSGHTAKNRLLSFARKPAPIQVSWMGYAGTTGLQSMDYYLTDKYFLPQKSFKDQFTEKLVYLPASAPFMPYESAPNVNDLPALTNGYITFGSFNRPNKLHADVIALWAKLMLALPTSRLILGGIPSEYSYDIITAWFAEHGVLKDRLSFYPRSNMVEYLTLHHKVDICLDTFPYNGGTTTLNAVWMGVPTLTLAGLTPTNRVGATIMLSLGLDEFVPENTKDFINQGLSITNDLVGLAQLRLDLRSRFSLSPARQPELIAKSVDRALRMMWQRWCDNLPPISLDVSDTQLSTLVDIE